MKVSFTKCNSTTAVVQKSTWIPIWWKFQEIYPPIGHTRKFVSKSHIVWTKSFFKDDDDQKMAIMRKAFQMFDTTKSGFIETIKISTILNTMGQLFDEAELMALINEEDPEGKNQVNFDGFCNIASHFLEEEDDEAMQQWVTDFEVVVVHGISRQIYVHRELKEAFRLYDREGNGYITTSTLKEILGALDDKLTSSDLDSIIQEIDTDGSGTVDFDEFMEMMTGD